MDPAISYLSLGWGKQSVTLAAMMALDVIPRADYLIHADTTHEKAATYAYAERMAPWLGEHGLNLVTVTADDTEILSRPEVTHLPAYSLGRADASEGVTTRQCTRHWKITPIRQFLSAELERRGQRKTPGIARAIMGISADEWRRVRDSDVKYIVNAYPLIDMKMTRGDCIRWLHEHGIPEPPKSACSFCPYQSQSTWRDLKRAGGSDWAYSLGVDEAIREIRDKHLLYLHPTRRPLSEAVEIPEDHGQARMDIDEAPCDSGHCFT